MFFSVVRRQFFIDLPDVIDGFRGLVSEPLQLGISIVVAVVVAVVSAAAAAGFWGFVGVAGFCCDGVGWACGGVWSATRFVDSDEKQV